MICQGHDMTEGCDRACIINLNLILLSCIMQWSHHIATWFYSSPQGLIHLGKDLECYLYLMTYLSYFLTKLTNTVSSTCRAQAARNAGGRCSSTTHCRSRGFCHLLLQPLSTSSRRLLLLILTSLTLLFHVLLDHSPSAAWGSWRGKQLQHAVIRPLLPPSQLRGQYELLVIWLWGLFAGGSG